MGLVNGNVGNGMRLLVIARSALIFVSLMVLSTDVFANWSRIGTYQDGSACNSSKAQHQALNPNDGYRCVSVGEGFVALERNRNPECPEGTAWDTALSACLGVPGDPAQCVDEPNPPQCECEAAGNVWNSIDGICENIPNCGNDEYYHADINACLPQPPCADDLVLSDDGTCGAPNPDNPNPDNPNPDNPNPDNPNPDNPNPDNPNPDNPNPDNPNPDNPNPDNPNPDNPNPDNPNPDEPGPINPPTAEFDGKVSDSQTHNLLNQLLNEQSTANTDHSSRLQSAVNELQNNGTKLDGVNDNLSGIGQTLSDSLDQQTAANLLHADNGLKLDGVNDKLQTNNDLLEGITSELTGGPTGPDKSELEDEVNDTATLTQSTERLQDAFLNQPYIAAVSQIPSLGTSTSCPTYTDNIPIIGVQTVDSHCVVLEQYRGFISALMIGIWSVVALVLFLKA